MITISSQAEADKLQDFARCPPKKPILDLLFDLKGKEICLNDLRWARNITVVGRGVLRLPDLELVMNNFHVDTVHAAVYADSLSYAGDIILPNAKDTLVYGNLEDFDVLKSMISIPDDVQIGDEPPGSSLTNTHWIASDRTYALAYFYEEDEPKFIAGCREFKTIDDAFDHWWMRMYGKTGAAGTQWGTQEERALMFAFALTFFKDEMKRGGLL